MNPFTGAVRLCARRHLGSLSVREHGHPGVRVQGHILQHQPTGPADQLQPDQRRVSGEEDPSPVRSGGRQKQGVTRERRCVLALKRQPCTRPNTDRGQSFESVP